MNKVTVSVIVVLVLILLVGGSQLFRTTSNSSATPTPAISTTDNSTANTIVTASPSITTTTTPSPSGNGPVKEFSVMASNFKFTPDKITVKKGDTVKINFTADGSHHNFTIDEFKVASRTIGTGDQDTVQFVADKAGTFTYYCSVPGHRQLGQEGTLTVEP